MPPVLTYATLVAACFLVPSLALTRGAPLLAGDQGVLVRWRGHRVGRDQDLVALTVWALRRSRQLDAALQRLTRLLASDAAMSATRQLGNRLAYRQLLADLAAVPPLPDLSDEPTTRDAWLILERADGVAGRPLQTLPGRPDVELLDVGWSWR